MKRILTRTALVLVSLLGVVLLVGVGFTLVRQHSADQELFLAGTIPTIIAQGVYKGTVPFETTWKGKVLYPTTNEGHNIFVYATPEGDALVEKYDFTYSVTKGYHDERDVIRLDYNVEGNPWWLKYIADEMVETSPGNFLGKVHILLIPGYPFTMGFFRLEKNSGPTHVG